MSTEKKTRMSQKHGPCSAAEARWLSCFRPSGCPRCYTDCSSDGCYFGSCPAYCLTGCNFDIELFGRHGYWPSGFWLSGKTNCKLNCAMAN